MYAGDAVTHAGRAAAQQEAEDAGLDSRIVNEALSYQVCLLHLACNHPFVYWYTTF